MHMICCTMNIACILYYYSQTLITNKSTMLKFLKSIRNQSRLKIRSYLIRNAITRPTFISIKKLVNRYYIITYFALWRLFIKIFPYEKCMSFYPIRKLNIEINKGARGETFSCWELNEARSYLTQVSERFHKMSKNWWLFTRPASEFLDNMMCSYDPINYIVACNKLYHHKINETHIIFTNQSQHDEDNKLSRINCKDEMNVFSDQMYSRINYRITKIQKKFYRFPNSLISKNDALDSKKNYKLENLNLSNELFYSTEDRSLGEPSRIKHQIKFNYMNSTFYIGNPRWDKAYSLDDGSKDVYGRVGRIHVCVHDNKTHTKENYYIQHEDIIEFQGHSSGAEDCRALLTDNGPMILFNALTHLGHRKMFIHDITRKKTSMLWGAQSQMNKVEKNWVPYFDGADMIFVYSHVPTQIMRLKSFNTGECELLYRKNNRKLSKPRSVYGGSNIIPWSPTMNLTFAHTRGPWHAIPLLLDDRCQTAQIGKKLNFQLADQLDLKSPRKEVEYPYFLNICDDEIELFLEVEDCVSVKLTFSPESFARGLMCAKLQ